MRSQPLSLTNEQLFHLLDPLSDAIVVTDDALAVQFMNRAALDLTGVEADTPVNDLNVLLAASQLRAELLPAFPGPLRAFRLLRHRADTGSAPLQSQSPDVRQSERLLRHLNHQPRHILKLFDRLSTGLIALDAQEQICFLNQTAEALLGHAARLALGKPIAWLMPTFDTGLLGGQENSTESTPVKFTAEHRHHTLGGYVTHIGQQEDDIQFLLSFLDITPFQTRDAERAGLLRLIIHDLNNPLNVALNFADLLHFGLLKGAEASEAMKITTEQLHRMQDLLEDLSLLDHLSHDVRESFSTVDMDVLVAVVVNDLEQYALDRAVNLRLNPLPDCTCTTHGNERLLRQGVHNLVQNAIKYSPKGWVRVTLRLKEQWIEVLVADNGVGIPLDKQSMLFKPFFRAHDLRTTHVNGTGLGLSLVSMIAAQHQGEVWVHSIPNKGSIFALRLSHSQANPVPTG